MDSSLMPDKPEVARHRSKRNRAGRPWELWEYADWFSGPGWYRLGRYRTREEAQRVLNLNLRKWAGYSVRGNSKYEIREAR